MPGRFLGILLCIAGLALPACTESLAHVLVDSPNKNNPFATVDPPKPLLALLGISSELRVQAGPPEASLATYIVDPPTAQPRGTVFILHGFLANAFVMAPQANALAKAGYRAVLVDLRGNGGSTGDTLSFGVHESKDISQVIDCFEKHNLIAGKLGILGISYGAATAIQTAGRDPRISAVVSLASFATMREEVPHYGRTLVPGIGYQSDAEYTAIINAAGKIGDFNPDDASPLAAIQKTKAAVLLVHGKSDMVIPVTQAMELHAAALDHSELMLVPSTGHVGLWTDFDGSVAMATQNWFAAHL